MNPELNSYFLFNLKIRDVINTTGSREWDSPVIAFNLVLLERWAICNI